LLVFEIGLSLAFEISERVHFVVKILLRNAPDDALRQAYGAGIKWQPVNFFEQI
jgi:hypothetical protein